MKDRINIGVLVSPTSTLFTLVRLINLRVNMKAYKIWENKIENIHRNDIFIYDEEPLSDEARQMMNDFFENGGILIQLFSLDDEVGYDYIIKDGEFTNEEFKSIFNGLDLSLVNGIDDKLNVKIIKSNGVFISFSSNPFSESVLNGLEPPELAPPDGSPRKEGELNREHDAKDDVSLLDSPNMQLFKDLIHYCMKLSDEMKKDREKNSEIPRSKVAVLIHGRSLWLDGVKTTVPELAKAVLEHLDLKKYSDELYNEPAFRHIDPDDLEKFPKIYYYHQTFADIDPDSADRVALENKLAQKYLDQAKKIHAEIRAEKDWNFDTVPLFFSDVAAYSQEGRNVEQLYLYPPSLIGQKSREKSLKLLLKCVLKPLGYKGINSYQLQVQDDKINVHPLVVVDVDLAKKPVKRTLIPSRNVIIIYGFELVRRLGNNSIDDFISSFNEVEDFGPGNENVLKILIFIKLDRLQTQQNIKRYSFKLKRVEERTRVKLKRQMEWLQDRLHFYMHVSRSRKHFERLGFKLIEIEDSRFLDQDIKTFLVDQLLPYVIAKRVSKVYQVFPSSLSGYLRTMLEPLDPRPEIAELSEIIKTLENG
ncbi:MAG: hypothetical protein ACTSXP_17910 [Promethearchaeota archaeon]